MSEESDGGFKVKDKRRFDDSGNLKEASDGKAPEEEEQKIEGDDFVVSDSPPSGGPAASEVPPIDYSSFVLSLATQAMVQLGEMPSPPGVEIPKNPQAAKHTIDVIEMLELKTKGNLTEAEQKLTEEILHNLRLGFVKSQGS